MSSNRLPSYSFPRSSPSKSSSLAVVIKLPLGAHLTLFPRAAHIIHSVFFPQMLPNTLLHCSSKLPESRSPSNLVHLSFNRYF